MILAWSGSINDIPKGWHLCDGSNGTPDLRDRFIVGAGNSYNIGSIGGENYHTLTVAEMPSHNHGASNNTSIVLGYYVSSGYGFGRFDTTDVATPTIGGVWSGDYPLPSDGGSQAHENRPPYYALAYIQRI